MNERINELWARAVDTAVPETYTSLSWAQIEKIKLVFAQLIVRECLGIVHDAERGGSNEIWDNAALSWNNALKFIRRDLQEHFGVEE